MKKILLIGGCGFIGHNLAIHLKKNFQVEIVDGLNVNNLFAFNKNDTENLEFYRKILLERLSIIEKEKINLNIIDVRNYHDTSYIINQVNPDVVIHLAAVSHANKSIKNPHNTFDHSLRTLENVLDACRKNKPHLIYMSSSMVYGNFNGKNVSEDDEKNPIDIYGTLKLSGELILKSYARVFDIPYTIIRPSALYGERCVSRRVGQIFIENAIRGNDIIINGSGEEKLDFTYVKDLVMGIESCIKNDKSLNETFNITFGEGRKINDLIQILLEEFPRTKVIRKEKDKFSPERGTLNISKAKKKISYSPNYNIEKGYREYISWYKSKYSELEK